MVTKTPLTIQDYFRQAGLGGQGAGLRDGGRVPAPGGDHSFGQALAQARAASAPAPTARRIVDYLRSPVASRLPRRQPGLDQQAQALSPASAIRAATQPAAIPDDTTTAGDAAAPSEPFRNAEAPAVQARIEAAIRGAAATYRLSAGLIRSVIRAESNFQVRAVSPAGAQGLMQLMPATARELGVSDPFDIEQNIDGGARYLRQMLDRFDGNLKMALAAYNAGPGKVLRYNGEVPYRETREYVQKVLAFTERYAV